MKIDMPDTNATVLSPIFERYSSILQDPIGRGPIVVEGSALIAMETGRCIELNDGIPDFSFEGETSAGTAANEVSEAVRRFYGQTPLPVYGEIQTRQDLQKTIGLDVFARLLEEQLPTGALVWDAGCGTGQLSNFLGMSWKRRVFAGDFCLNSLKLAKEFADKNVIRNVSFAQMNLFAPPFKDDVFDVVISNSVLHHTDDCEGGFRSILGKLKPGGHILVGLYNRYARLPALWKRGASSEHQNPHETCRSMDEVLGWFDRYGVDFVNSIPHVDGSELAAEERLFEPRSRGHAVGRVATQLEMLFSGGQGGGLFIMIGKKR